MTKCGNDHDTETTIIKTEELQKQKQRQTYFLLQLRQPFSAFSRDTHLMVLVIKF